MRPTARLAATACLLIALPLAEAAAQGQGIIRPNQQPGAGAAAPAPALPGLAGRRTPAPIEAEPGVALSPNAALFDAITRGDLAAARDAVTRGANLEARNALGLTPLDAAVDQGRHDIAFYLLSTRDPSRPASPPPTPADTEPARTQAGALPATPARALPETPTRAVPATPTRAAPATPAAAEPAPSRNARLWSGDGGTPRPEIGFLGFDAGRPAGAEPARR